MTQRLLIWLQTWLRHLRDQESAHPDAAQGATETEYDDRDSVSPFAPEEQRIGSDHHKADTSEQSEDTSHQRELVRWTRNLAWVTGALAAATFIVAAFSGWQAYEGRRASIQQHADTLAALRPYIKVTADVSRDLDLFDPLPTNTLPISITAQNVGKSPAYGVVTAVWPFPNYIIHDTTNYFEPDIMAQQKTLCNMIGSPPGPTLWVGETRHHMEDVSHILITIPTDIRENLEKRKSMFSIYAFGCINYSSGFIAGSHQTGFIYKLVRHPPGLVGAKYVDRFGFGAIVPRAELEWLPESVAPGQNN